MKAVTICFGGHAVKYGGEVNHGDVNFILDMQERVRVAQWQAEVPEQS